MFGPSHHPPSAAVVSRLRDATTVVLDVDGTITGIYGVVRERILDAVPRLAVPVGLATARSMRELEAAFPAGVPCESVFRGHVLVEDGAALAVPRDREGRGYTVESCIEPAPQRAVNRFRDMFLDSLEPLNTIEGLYQIKGVESAHVRVPPYRDFVASVSIWQRSVDERIDAGAVRRWCDDSIQRLGLDKHLSSLQLGDGTVRITVRGVDKGSGLQRLADTGRIKLRSTAYVGDGLNDVPAARVVKGAGGIVIAVGTTTPELVALADYVIRGQRSGGVEDLLQMMSATS